MWMTLASMRRKQHREIVQFFATFRRSCESEPAGRPPDPPRRAAPEQPGRQLSARMRDCSAMSEPTTPLPRGFRAHVANVGIKDSTDDFVIVASDVPCAASAVFTKSRFAGPSVVV